MDMLVGLLYFIAASVSIGIGVLLESAFSAAWEDKQEAERGTESKEKDREEESAEVEREQGKLSSPEQPASAPALLSGVKGIIDTSSIADAVKKRLKDVGVCLPNNASTNELVRKAVDAMVEEMVQRLQQSAEALSQVSTGEMDAATLQQQHPKTSAVLESVKQGLTARGLTASSSVLDVVNSITQGTSAIGQQRQQATICGGTGADVISKAASTAEGATGAAEGATAGVVNEAVGLTTNETGTTTAETGTSVTNGTTTTLTASSEAATCHTFDDEDQQHTGTCPANVVDNSSPGSGGPSTYVEEAQPLGGGEDMAPIA
ncbi:hypothetical protein GH714_042716 [Hevea brasiliensis]|uniref:Uncharacterized protein n=1 Tax=Hevea brasiliensis TaxID=3981 RepID=A0A6A6JZ79_HEVBR|nr:hypothetical protein GH714_042716 [Hevea brasiliensis]